MDKLPEYLRDSFDWFIGKARRKEKDVSSAAPSNESESKQYLQAPTLECTTPEVKLREVVNLPEGVDYNEWIASHTLAFFDHINLLYGTISEFCSMSGCPDMSGPCNRQYLWIDEKGKRCKLAAPQYIDYVMTFTQKTVNDESVFPTKFDKDFPSSFESIVKKILRLLFHVTAHMYHSHFKEIVLLNLHSHLNCIFAHLVLFNDRFKLVDDKEVEVLHDLAIALRLFTPVVGSETSGAMTPTDNHNLQAGDDQGFANSAIVDNNNGVITQQCRSISPLVEANTKCANLIENNPIIRGTDSTDSSSMSPYPLPLNSSNVSQWMSDKSCSVGVYPDRRSISASAIVLSSSDPSIPASLSRRCNSDRTSGRTSAMYHHSTRGSICGMNTAPLFATCGSAPIKFQ